MKTKIHFMNTESTPSDDEIRRFMNFDQVVEAARKQSVKKKTSKLWIVLPVALALFSVWYVTGSRNNHQEVQNDNAFERNDEQPKRAENHHATKDSSLHIETDRDLNEVSVGKLSDDSQSTGNDHSAASGIPGNNSPRRNRSGSEPQKQPHSGSEQNNKVTQSDVYVQAEPRHGYTHLYTYFNENLTYPTEAIRDSVRGVETVSFTIDENGRPINITITQSLGKPFDQEAMRLIREMPEWTPAMLNGRAVASQLSLPLTFEVRRIKKP